MLYQLRRPSVATSGADSLGGACARAAISGLKSAGHEVRSKTLYSDANDLKVGPSFGGKDFSPALSSSERSLYYSETASRQSEIAEAIADLRWAQVSNLPIILKRTRI